MVGRRLNPGRPLEGVGFRVSVGEREKRGIGLLLSRVY